MTKEFFIILTQEHAETALIDVWKGEDETPVEDIAVRPEPEYLKTMIQEKRDKFSYYEWFYDSVLSFVVGRSFWKNNMTTTLGKDMATVSDEALGLLLLENNWEVWCARAMQVRLGKCIT